MATQNYPEKEAFYKKLEAKIEKKRMDNAHYFDQDQYNKFIRETKEAALRRHGTRDFRRLHRFNVMELDGEERLIVPVKKIGDQPRFYARIDELYDIIKEAHSDMHKGKGRIIAACKPKWKNITQEAILLFLSLCPGCLTKVRAQKRGLTVKPMVFKQSNARVQVDLIDMQSSPDGPYKYIMNVQDHLTKFTHLRPLERKTQENVANGLLEIFLSFGAPHVLQTDNGREFTNHVIKSLSETWPELKMVHGAPRHSQSQGSVERSNQDVQVMLNQWMETNQTTRWALGLNFVANQKNRSIHQGIGRSPAEAMFGRPMEVGLTSRYPSGLVQQLETEEELEEFLANIKIHDGKRRTGIT
ncbi:KRAB-A domain-containing protein 2-like [Thrips palmi]|uniref:KRAB-A domain-containing protein 2-like n=1 Tax=Thrips palmi TaxID=161013 RepID=A0A6P8ZBX3_THRPL|nr:KRAB-A domain-containing protein 2-like [Thrips palmi]